MASYTVYNLGNKATISLGHGLGVPDSVVWDFVDAIEPYLNPDYPVSVRKTDDYTVITKPTTE